MLEIERQLASAVTDKFEEEIHRLRVVAENLWDNKGAAYDTEVSLMQRLPLGHLSLVHEIVKKVLRLKGEFASGVLESKGVESIEEQLLDIANYAIALAAILATEKRFDTVELKFERKA